MEASQQILIIILSSALAILLILAIVVAVLAIKLLKVVKQITEKADHIVTNVEQVGDTFKNVAGPMAIVKIVSNIIRMVSKKS